MRIPVSFMLFGEKITVERCEALLEKDSCVGQALYRKNAIELQTNTPSVLRPSTHIEVTFLHELLHWIFYVLEEHELKENEKLVDTMARLLHQAISTAEYAEENPDATI